MKFSFTLTLIIYALISNTYSQGTKTIVSQLDSVTPANTSLSTFIPVEVAAEYPGGMSNFYSRVISSIKLPELVSLFGIKGKIIVSFNVDSTGHINWVNPVRTIGLGMDEAVTSAITQSSKWIPARQNGKGTSMRFTVPFSFDITKDVITIHELKKSSYTFIFSINSQLYDLDNAKRLLGDSFAHNRIDELTPYQDTPPFKVKDKNRLFLIIIK